MRSEGASPAEDRLAEAGHSESGPSESGPSPETLAPRRPPGPVAPIVPVLLTGGSGTRLWPLSRRSYPKQFAPLGRGLSQGMGQGTGMGQGEAQSLFQTSVARLSGRGFARPVVLTAEAFRFVVTEQLGALGCLPEVVLIEPEPRNTAPAVLAAALWQAARNPQALMLIAPSDHLIPDAAAFRACVQAAAGAARAGRIVTFGIRPDRAETGYGWLEPAPESGPGPAAGPDRALRALHRFVEKPGAEAAAAMLAGGRHLWNAGLFLASAETLVAAFRAHAPDLCAPVAEAVAGAEPDLGFHRLAAAPWRRARDVSLDYAVMERAENLSVAPYDGAWSDLGGWDAVWRAGGPDGAGPDAAGVVTGGAATAIDCRNTLLVAEGEGLALVGLGLSDIVAVAMPDAVLIAHRDRAQDVRLAVAALEAAGVPQAGAFPRAHRPWGWFETLARGERFQVKRIMVHPGGQLSRQSHLHRAEHWVVVAGAARVSLGERVMILAENQSVYVPQGEIHRLENPGRLALTLIEVQTGSYLGEDDITRYEDAYRRG